MSHFIPFRQLGIDVDGNCHGTEGPWVFDANRMIVKSTLPRTGMRPAGDPFPTVCRLPSSYTPQVVDGYLLAAAPELLAACMSMVQDLEDQLMDCDSPGSQQTLQAQIAYIKRAITKARGEAE